MGDPRFAEHLSVFVDVARYGSFSAAARRRSVVPSSIVRQIDALEASLGVPLFVRSTRGLALTDAGQLLFERARRLLDELADTQAEVSDSHGAIRGALRLACFPSFGRRYVIPALDRLMSQHPELRAELDLTERLADPVTDRLDGVIRIGRLADSGLIATRLATQTRLLVASPGYLERHGVPRCPGDLAVHRLLDKVHGPDLLGWADVAGAPLGRLPATLPAFRCDDFEALRQAALAGMGVALLANWLVGPDVLDGGLIRLPLQGESWNLAPGGIHLLRPLANASQKLRVFTSVLRRVIETTSGWDGVPASAP